MKTTVEIPDPLLARAKALAAREGRTLRDLIELGLRQVIKDAKARRQAFELRDASVAGDGLQEGLSYDAWDQILERAYEHRG